MLPCMTRSLVARSIFVLALLAAPCAAQEPKLETGRWRAWLSFDGWEVPFELDVQPAAEGAGARAVRRVWIVNGPERISISRVEWRGGDLVLGLDHYSGEVVARPGADGRSLEGQYTRGQRVLPFHARLGGTRFAPLTEGEGTSDPAAVVGRWALDDDGREKTWIATFALQPDGSILGNTARVEGDLRYLAGTFERGRLRLSTWDGAHSVLYDGRLEADGTLRGERRFGGGTSHWVARRDEHAALPDPWTLTPWRDGTDLAAIKVQDLAADHEVTLASAIAGAPCVVYLLGTWCPNCSDETDYLVDLHARFAARGLEVVGLTYERSADPLRASALVREYVRRHAVPYPVLWGGVASATCFPGIAKIVAFPTTIVFDRGGRVRAVCTGFRGPAAVAEHAAFRARLEALVEELLTDE
jgi:peroxiredoxin